MGRQHQETDPCGLWAPILPNLTQPLMHTQQPRIALRIAKSKGQALRTRELLEAPGVPGESAAVMGRAGRCEQVQVLVQA